MKEKLFEREKELFGDNTFRENNKVLLQGKLVRTFEFSYEVFFDKFYEAKISLERMSGVKDTIPVVVSEYLFDTVKGFEEGEMIEVLGEYRSFNVIDDKGKGHVKLYVYAKRVNKAETLEYENTVFIEGNLVKIPNYRKTPLGREICDLMLAVNRNYGKTSYIPCIAWGEKARWSESLKIGTKLKIFGRIQSRIYEKKLSETEIILCTAYEVSIFEVKKEN